MHCRIFGAHILVGHSLRESGLRAPYCGFSKGPMCQRIDPAQKKYTVCSSCVFFVTANVKISNISYIIISNHVILEKTTRHWQHFACRGQQHASWGAISRTGILNTTSCLPGCALVVGGDIAHSLLPSLQLSALLNLRIYRGAILPKRVR